MKFNVKFPEIDPGSHWWEASALTTALSLHPILLDMFTLKISCTKLSFLMIQTIITYLEGWLAIFRVKIATTREYYKHILLLI